LVETGVDGDELMDAIRVATLNMTITPMMAGSAFKNKGVASVEELRDICVDSGVKMIGCQMTMDVFGFSKDEFIDGVEVGGAATFLEFASDSDIQMFI
jgi:peroxiredoxin family protein